MLVLVYTNPCIGVHKNTKCNKLCDIFSLCKCLKISFSEVGRFFILNQVLGPVCTRKKLLNSHPFGNVISNLTSDRLIKTLTKLASYPKFAETPFETYYCTWHLKYN